MLELKSMKKLIYGLSIFALAWILIGLNITESSDCSSSDEWKDDLLFNGLSYDEWSKDFYDSQTTTQQDTGDALIPVSEILISAYYQLLNNKTHKVKAVEPINGRAPSLRDESVIFSLSPFSREKKDYVEQTARAEIDTNNLDILERCAFIGDEPQPEDQIAFNFFSEFKNTSAVVETFFTRIITGIIEEDNIGTNLEKDRSNLLNNIYILITFFALSQAAIYAYERHNEYSASPADNTNTLLHANKRYGAITSGNSDESDESTESDDGDDGNLQVVVIGVAP